MADKNVVDISVSRADREDRIEGVVRELLSYIGEDPAREGLRETPRRVRDSWREWCGGYDVDVEALMKHFEHDLASPNEVVTMQNIPVYSHCEHHLVPFFGVAHIAYSPKSRVIGLSKLARVVDAYSRRLQVQERLGNQVADALVEHLAPRGVGVVVRCRHLCMEARGIRSRGTVTTTRTFRGCFLEQSELRREFLGSLPAD